MPLPYLLLDIDGVLIPFPAADDSTPPTYAPHTVLPTGRHPDDPVSIWLDPSQGGIPTDLLASGLVTSVWCTSWRKDASRSSDLSWGCPNSLTSTCLAARSPPATPTATCGSATTSTSGRQTPRRLDRRRLHQPRPRLGGGAHGRGNADPHRSARPTSRAAARAPDRARDMVLAAAHSPRGLTTDALAATISEGIRVLRERERPAACGLAVCGLRSAVVASPPMSESAGSERPPNPLRRRSGGLSPNILRR